MFIEHRQYLAILDEIQYLKKDNTLLRQENTILSEQLMKEREKRLQLEESHQRNMKLIEELHAKTIASQSDNTKQIVLKIGECNDKTKSFLQDKFKVLESLSCDQVRQTELKHAKNKLDLYELTEFTNKLRNIHRESQQNSQSMGQTISNKKLSLSELTKWVKYMAMVNLTQQKMGLTGSMSTSNIKKQSKKVSGIKQNKSLLNSESKTKIIG